MSLFENPYPHAVRRARRYVPQSSNQSGQMMRSLLAMSTFQKRKRVVQESRIFVNPNVSPSKEIDEHDVRHANYRVLCPHFALGIGSRSSQNKLLAARDHAIPPTSADYTSMGDERGRYEYGGLSSQCMSILVIRDFRTRVDRFSILCCQPISEHVAWKRIQLDNLQKLNKNLHWNERRQRTIARLTRHSIA